MSVKETIIEHPVYALLAVTTVIITVSIVAGLSLLSASSSTGFVSFRTQFVAFSALWGVALSIGLVVGFLGWAFAVKNKKSGTVT